MRRGTWPRPRPRRASGDSSTSARRAPTAIRPIRASPIDESAPLGQDIWVWDPYTRSKVECERILWRLAESGRLAVTVIRPSWLYGERDRTTVARLVDRLRAGERPPDRPRRQPAERDLRGERGRRGHPGRARPGLGGRGVQHHQPGADHPGASSSTSSPRPAAPPGSPTRPLRAWSTRRPSLLEAHGRLTRRPRPPLITRYATWLMGRNLEYSTAKAETRLGWDPALDYRESIERSVRWYLEHETTRRRRLRSPLKPVEQVRSADSPSSIRIHSPRPLSSPDRSGHDEMVQVGQGVPSSRRESLDASASTASARSSPGPTVSRPGKPSQPEGDRMRRIGRWVGSLALAVTAGWRRPAGRR